MGRFSLLLITVVCIVMSSGLSSATELRLTNDDYASTNPRVVVDGNYVYVAWRDWRDGFSGSELYWKKLDLSGNEVIADQRISISNGACNWADLGVDGNGRSALCWQQGSSIMFVVLDADGSQLFSPITVASGSCERPAIATHTDGRSTIIWDKDEGMLRKAYMAQYSASGTQTCATLNLSPGDLVGYAKHPAVDLDPLGNAYSSWFDMYNFSDGLWLSKRLVSCSQTHNYQYLNTGEQPNVSIAVPAENYFFAFMEQTVSGRKQIMCLAASLVNVSSSSGTARLPRIASAVENECYAVWYDNRDSNDEIYMAITNGDCGITSGPTRLTSDPASSQNPDIAVSMGEPRQWWVVWQDNRDGNYEIYFETSWTPQQPLISVDVPSLSFTAVLNDDPPDDQAFTITNAGIGTLNWSITDDADWLALDPLSGNSNLQEINVSVNTTNLPVGENEATITISSTNANNAPFMLDVSYTISEPAAHICVDPLEIVFGGIQFGTLPASQSLTISNCGGGNLDWQIDGVPSWLDVVPISGTGSETELTLAVNTTDFSPGTYSGTITLNSSNADNSGLLVPVEYVIYPQGSVALVYGTNQLETGLPVPDAYLEIYRNNALVERLGPTDATGMVTPYDLQVGDEVYAFRIVGAARTWKLLHPDVPTYLIPDPLPDPSCDEPPWAAFYFNYLDNQYVDLDDNLTKVLYDGSNAIVELDHVIAKLNLAVGYDHNLPEDRFDIIIDSLKLGLNRTNRFLLDATNGLVMLDSVWIISGPTAIPYCDVQISRSTDMPGETVPATNDLAYPSYFHIGPQMYFGREDIVDFNFRRGLTHELGHYFFNLGDEYPATYDGVKYGGLCDNPENRSCIMKSIVRTLPTEFCDLNHSTEPTMHQNVCHDGQSCWEYLSNEWNDFESKLPTDWCPWLLLGEKIAWTRPDHSVPYVRGPYIEMEQTTSHAIDFTVTALPSPTTEDVQIVVRRDERNGGFLIIVFGSGVFKSIADIQTIDTVRYVRYFDESKYDTEIVLPSVESHDHIYIVGDNSLPTVLSSDTISGPLDIQLQTLPFEQTSVNFVSMEPNVLGTSITFRLHTSPVAGEAWTATVVPSGEPPIVVTMNQVNDSLHEAAVSLAGNDFVTGVVVLEDASGKSVIAERWELAKLVDTAYNYYEVLGQYSLAGTPVQSGDPIWSGIVSTALPKFVDRSISQTYPSRPIYVSFSEALNPADSISLGILGDTTIDSTASIVMIDAESTQYEELSTVVLQATGFAYSKINSEGIFLLAIQDPEICCGVYTGGNTGNTDCDSEGKTNLADVTKLIDRIYLSKQLLCCEANGNVDGDVEGKMNLADITRLIDHIYLSKQPTAACQ